MTNSTFAIRKFITTCYNKCQDSYCWYNVPKLLSDEDINKMKAYFEEHNYKFMLIINGCNELRPQRTWDSIPVFLKGTRDGNIMHQDINTFVFCSWVNEYDEYKNDIEELINSIPEDIDYRVFIKNNTL